MAVNDENGVGNQPVTEKSGVRIDVRITGINSSFYLSNQQDFRAALDCYSWPSAGEMCVMKHNGEAKVVIQFATYRGKCVVHRNGFVQCSAQLSFEEAEMVAAKIVWKFRVHAGQTVGLFRHRFHVISSAAELPFCVNLNRIKRNAPGPEVVFLPEINPFLIYHLDELKATVSLYRSGKLTIFSTGDCEARDDTMPKMIRAIQIVADIARECMIAKSEKSESASEMSEETENERSEFMWTHISLRRSQRLAALLKPPLLQATAHLPIVLKELRRASHRRLFNFLENFSKIHNRRFLSVAITELLEEKLSHETKLAFEVNKPFFAPKWKKKPKVREGLIVPKIRFSKREENIINC